MALKIVAVVARSHNNVIGRDGDMPWRLSSDLKHFKALTMGKPMIMGRQTWDAIGRLLPGRETIVVTRNAAFEAPGAHVANSPEAALTLATALAQDMDADEIIIAGGEEIYRLFLDTTDRVELTEIALETTGDAYFPALDPAAWREVSRAPQQRGPKDDVDFSYVTLERHPAR